jgi:polysaccharide biosynthesis/export protein
MSSFLNRIIICSFFMAIAAGCSTVGDTLGISPPAHKLLNDAKEIRDTAPITPAVGRELAKELLPPHIVEQGETLVIQPVDLDSPIRLPSDQTVLPDGTIDLGKYGRPIVVGKTIPQVETLVWDLIKALEKQGTAVSVRLVGRPSSVYYVFGEVNAPGAFPITGRETVLDGIVSAGGVTKKASKENIILSRPTAPNSCRIVYPVCYPQIVQLGDTTTNYQLLPGDRIYVPSKGFFDSFLPEKCQRMCPACSQPQTSCFVGTCTSGGYAANSCYTLRTPTTSCANGSCAVGNPGTFLTPSVPQGIPSSMSNDQRLLQTAPAPRALSNPSDLIQSTEESSK